jgi:PilZ domain/Gram-negative bacterial TonB protein C-terminal
MSTTDQQSPPLASTLERRFYPRFVLPAPIFLPLDQDQAEASLLVNISENGLLLSTPSGLTCNFVTRLAIPLNGLQKPIRVTARVAWACETRKLAGIQWLDLGEHDREQIRKWGADMSLRLPQQESAERSPDASSLTSSSEAPDFNPAFSAGTPPATPQSASPSIAAPAFPALARKRAASDMDRRAVRLLLIGTACLVAAVVVIKAAPGGPFASLKEIHPDSVASSVRAPETGPVPLLQHTSPRSSPPQLGALAASSDGAAFERRRSARLASTIENPVSREGDRSLTTAVPVTIETAPESGSASPRVPALSGDLSSAETPLSDDPLTRKQPVPEQTHASGAAAPVTIPSNPYASSSNAESNTPLRSTPSVPSPSSVGPLTDVEPRQNRTLEVHVTSGGSASFLSLPGEHLLESPSLTMHIQRSILMPSTKAAWPSHRIRKVLVGELISHADPQFTLPPNSSAVSLCVKATIAKDGSIENIKQILGPADLAPAVAKALKQWRYQPTLVDGQPVETQCYVTLQFRATPYHLARR